MRLLILSLLALSQFAFAEDFQLSLLEARCGVPGTEDFQSASLGTKAALIKDGAEVSITGFAVTFEGGRPKDTDAEYDLLGARKYQISEKALVFKCAKADLRLRVLGLDDYLTLQTMITKLPFHDKCNDSDLRYKKCGDMTNVYNMAMFQAMQSGKMLLINYGYDGCVWCDNMGDILNDSELGAAVREKFQIINVAGSRAVNRTTGRFLKNLGEHAIAPRSSGLPELFLVNPANMKITIIDPVDMEIDQDYNREALVQRILDTAGTL